jgi:hypothetical protein
VLKYNGGGDWYGNPTSVPNLVKFCNAQLGMGINPEVPVVEVGSPDLFTYPLVHMTGHGNVVFSQQEAENLRTYLIAVASCTSATTTAWTPSSGPMMKRVFPELEFLELPFAHAIYHQKFDFAQGLPKVHEHDNKPPKGFGLFWEGRWSVSTTSSATWAMAGRMPTSMATARPTAPRPCRWARTSCGSRSAERVECITYYNQHNINYTPAGIIEMGEYGGYEISSNYTGWLSAMNARAAGVAPVELTMTSSVNNTTRVLTVTLNAEFTYAVAGPHKLNVYVAEDNVPGPQQNAPANYIHNKVMRAMLGGVDGTTGVVPTTPVVGTSYSQTYTYTVPVGFDISELYLIGVLENSPGGFDNRYSLNSVTRSVAGVGIADLDLGDNSLQAYPNPFINELYVDVADFSGAARVELFTMDGRSVFQNNIVLGTSASTRLDLGGDQLVNGAYLLRITTEKGHAEQRIVKMD